jgi:hypothetical protein
MSTTPLENLRKRKTRQKTEKEKRECTIDSMKGMQRTKLAASKQGEMKTKTKDFKEVGKISINKKFNCTSDLLMSVP